MIFYPKAFVSGVTSLLLLGGLASGHVEDYVVQRGTGTICNFYEENAALRCLYQDQRPTCVLSAIATGADTFQITSNFRGMVHYDAVFIMAQAVGFNKELAYWLAAFSQAVDFVGFEALDSCGEELPQAYWTPPLRGFLRTSTSTGGSIRHLGVPFGLEKPSENYTGLHPDLENFDYEGTLSIFRLWARGEIDLACHGGYRNPTEDGNYFLGDACLELDIPMSTTGVSTAVTGPIPLSGGAPEFGEQIIHYECLDDPLCEGDENGDITKTDITYVSDFGKYLSEHPQAKMENGTDVPEVIARMGIYMHMLADRVSHYYCTDVEGTGIYVRENGTFDQILDDEQCNFFYHGMEHYWEQSVEHPLAPQSYAALKLYYDELLSFRGVVQDDFPDWFVRDPDNYDDLVGNDDNKGPIDAAFVIVDAQDRFNAAMDVIDSFGYARPPGFEKGSTEQCAGPRLFVKVEGETLPTPAVTRVAVAQLFQIDNFCVIAMRTDQYKRFYGTTRANLRAEEEENALYISVSRECTGANGPQIQQIGAAIRGGLISDAFPDANLATLVSLPGIEVPGFPVEASEDGPGLRGRK